MKVATDYNCAICNTLLFQRPEGKKKVRVLECQHMYHTSCLNKIYETVGVTENKYPFPCILCKNFIKIVPGKNFSFTLQELLKKCAKIQQKSLPKLEHELTDQYFLKCLNGFSISLEAEKGHQSTSQQKDIEDLAENRHSYFDNSENDEDLYPS